MNDDDLSAAHINDWLDSVAMECGPGNYLDQLRVEQDSELGYWMLVDNNESAAIDAEQFLSLLEQLETTTDFKEALALGNADWIGAKIWELDKTLWRKQTTL